MKVRTNGAYFRPSADSLMHPVVRAAPARSEKHTIEVFKAGLGRGRPTGVYRNRVRSRRADFGESWRPADVRPCGSEAGLAPIHGSCSATRTEAPYWDPRGRSRLADRSLNTDMDRAAGDDLSNPLIERAADAQNGRLSEWRSATLRNPLRFCLVALGNLDKCPLCDKIRHPVRKPPTSPGLLMHETTRSHIASSLKAATRPLRRCR